MLLKYYAETRVTNVKRAVLKRCKAKTRAKHYARPDGHVTVNALKKAMDRKYAAYEPPKRPLWDHLECHRQACVAPRLVSFNPERFRLIYKVPSKVGRYSVIHKKLQRFSLFSRSQTTRWLCRPLPKLPKDPLLQRFFWRNLFLKRLLWRTTVLLAILKAPKDF